MNKLLIVLFSILLLIVITFFVLGVMSKKGEAPGLKSGQLQACTSTENCVISEVINGKPNTIEPYAFEEEQGAFMAKLKTTVESLGGNVIKLNENYISATFTSGIFGFVDDLELRLTEDKLLHFRSASRVGRSDLGANKKRVEALKSMLSH